MNVRYRVTLTQDERDELEALLRGGKSPARKLKRAQILLAADAGVSDEGIAASVGVGGSTVYRTKQRFVEGNLERALTEEARLGAERKLTGKEEGRVLKQSLALTHVRTQLGDLAFGPKAGTQQTVGMEPLQPLRIADVSLPSGYMLGIARIDQEHRKATSVE